MRFPFILLAGLQLALCLPSPDGKTSSPSTEIQRATQFYSVYPTDPTNANEIAETQKFLSSIDDDVLENRNTEGLVSWRVSLKDEASSERLKEYSGIRIVELESSPLGQRSLETREDEGEDKEEPLWVVYATDSATADETKKIGEWLESRATDKGRFLSHISDSETENGDVYMWGTTLSEADLEDVKKLPGVDGVEQDSLMEPDEHNSADIHFPDQTSEQSHRSHGSLKSKRNSVEWDIQRGADSELRELGQRSIEKRGQGYNGWIVYTKDPANTDENNRTMEWLKTHNLDKKFPIYTRNDRNGQVKAMGVVDLDESSVEEAKKLPGVKGVVKNLKTTQMFMKPEHKANQKRTASAPQQTKKEKRAVEWTKQDDADDWGLREISRYEKQASGPRDLRDFVYEKQAGAGTYVYVIDGGVEARVKDANGNQVFAQFDESDQEETPRAELEYDDTLTSGPLKDSQPDGHGTMVASKAVSTKYGVAKGAKFISIKVSEDFWDVEKGLEIVAERLSGNPDRAAKSVVVVARGIFPPEDGSEFDTLMVDDLYESIDTLLEMGVPIVWPSGNVPDTPEGELDPERKEVEALPIILADDDLPLIIVGATDEQGEVADFTQVGDVITVFAPGDKVDVHDHKDGKEIQDKGTSYAAPMVAGVIATYLGRDSPPWEDGEMNKERVIRIRNSMKDPKTSWQRKDGGERVIWNGADEKAWKDAGGRFCEGKQKRGFGSIFDQIDTLNGCSPPTESSTPSPPPPPPPPKENPKTCNGIEGKNYITPGTAGYFIDNVFCPEAATQGHLDENSGSIARTYLKGTMEQIDFAIDWSPDLDFKPNLDDCKKYMWELIHNCDTDRGPMFWKGGGNIHVDQVVYRWNPTAPRQPAMDKPTGGCNFGYKALWDEYTIWGAGWLNSGFGHELYDAMKDKNLSPTEWKFEYGLGDDGREWTARFRTTIFSEDRMEDVVKGVANFPDFGLDCE